ncbi:hypothetical protein ABZ543_08410 [Streptomyces roseifaciens]
MIWLYLFVSYGEAVDAVLSTADVWGSVVLGAACLGRGVRRIPGRRRGTDSSPDSDADSLPDIAAGELPQGN